MSNGKICINCYYIIPNASHQCYNCGELQLAFYRKNEDDENMTNKAIRQQQRENAHNIKSNLRYKPTKPHINNHNGEREQFRRFKQAAKGQLKAENGLVE